MEGCPAGPMPEAESAEQAPVEVELKLGFDVEHAEALLAHPALASPTAGRSRTRRLRSIYFDTPELALHQNGLSIRIRDGAETNLQTVKAKGHTSAGLMQRAEDEAPVLGAEPVLSSISDPDLRAAVLAETEDRGRSLHPTVETEVERTTREIEVDGTRIELAIDIGEVRTRLGARPIRELELELVEGDPRHLYDLALTVLETVPLHLSTESKAAVGFQTLLATSPTPSRARKIKLEPDALLDDAVAAIFEEATRQIVDNLPAVLDGSDPEGVHQLRVGSRRLRSALSLLKRSLPDRLGRELREELRWLAGEMGPARELDVFLEETLDPILVIRPGEAHLKRLRDAADEARTDAYARARAALREPRATALFLRLGRVLLTRSWRDQPLTPESAQLFAPARDQARSQLHRHHRKARKRGRDLSDLPVAELHELRIELKKLRYLGEFFASLFDRSEARRLLRRASRLQDALGSLNDGEMAREVLAQVLDRLGGDRGAVHHEAAGFVVGWIQRGTRDEMSRVEGLWTRFKAARPFWNEDDADS